MKVSIHLDEEQLKLACVAAARKERGFEERPIDHVTLHLDRPPHPTPGDPGAGFYAEVTFK